MNETIILKGNDVFTQLRVLNQTPKTGIRNKGKENQEEFEYHTMLFNGKGFTVDPTVVKAFNDGDIYQFTLVPSSYQRQMVDEEGNDLEGQFETINNYQYGGHSSYKQAKNVAKNLGELQAIERKYASADVEELVED